MSRYISALKFQFLTPFYDFLIRFFLREQTFKTRLIRNIPVSEPGNILDIGCGTATLAIMMKKEFPMSIVTALDGDPSILEMAKRKAARKKTSIRLVEGMSYNLPFEDDRYEVVTSSLMMHHLTDENKTMTMKEVHRVLKPGAAVMVADWGKPSNLIMRILFLVVQMLDGFETTASNVRGEIPDFMLAAGFTDVRECSRMNSLLGTIAIYKGLKSSGT